MKSLIGGFIGLVLSIHVGAEPLLEGRVRLSSGQPAVGVQVRLFDLTDLRRSVGTTTDAAGYFALPLQTRSRGTALPTDFALGQNYPNPFNPSTIIPYQLPAAGHVRLDVFNVLGQRLATLVDAEQSARAHTTQWDGTDAAGRAAGAGVYIYRMSGGGVTVSRRMVLVDGQAGVPAVGAAAQGPVRSAVERAVEADDRIYGLTVSGEGLVAYVDPAFRVGVNEADIVLKEHGGSPLMKLAAGGILGDVNNDGQVDLFDALYVLLYNEDSYIALPNHVDISLGDVNGDGTVDLVDALILIQYSEDPSNPALPPGIGEGDDHGDTLSEATQVALGSSITGSLLADDTDYFRVTVSSLGTLVAYTTGSTDTYGSILDGSGSVLAEDDESGERSNFLVFTSVGAGTYYIEVRGYSSSTTGNYTLHVASGPSDLVVESPSVSDSTLLFRHPFTLQVTVRNQGAGPADATTLVYYRSTDATISSSDTRVASGYVSLLFSSDASAASISLIAPEDAGTYYYGACAQNVVGESNTSNNCSDAVRVTVSQMSQMYWTSAGTIQRANLDGSNIEDLVTGLGWARDLALDVAGGKMYWTTGAGRIQCANLDGSNIEDLVTGLDFPFDLALDVAGGKMYWRNAGRIQRANLDGSNIEDLVTGLGTPRGPVLDVVGGKMYWTDVGGRIQRANLDGSNIEDLVTGLDSPRRLALDVVGGKIYWLDWWDKIRRTNLDGSNIEDLVTGLDSPPEDLALDAAGGKMYWTDRSGTIRRTNLDGSNIEDLVTGLDSPRGLALYLSGAAGGGTTRTGNMSAEESQLTPEIIALYGTLVSSFQNIFFAALIPGTMSVEGEGGGLVEIAGNDWTLQDYSPDGALIINGTLNVGIDQTPIPLTGTIIFSGSQEAELVIDMELSVGADGLYATGTITIDGAEFDVAEILEAAEAE